MTRRLCCAPLVIGFLASMPALGDDAGLRAPAENSTSGRNITTAAESKASGMISLVVQRKDGVGSVAERVGAVITASWQNTEVLEIPASQAEAVEALLQLTPGVESVERDAVVSTPNPKAASAPSSGTVSAQGDTESTSAGPDDPRTRDQYWWRSVDQYAGASSVEQAWQRSLVNEKLRIVVVDGGFANHRDFDWTNGISLVDDERGYLSYDADSCDAYHGQSVASIIGSRTNNGTGMAGMVDADFHAARVLACDSSGHLYDVARAIRWAAGEDVGTGRQLPEPADIVNLSLGAEAGCSSNLQSAINAANRAGTLVVASAGNNGNDASNYAPASCNGVITVGAVTRNGSQTSFSNHGAPLTLSALGQQVRVQGPDDDYRWMSGTSFSTPIVSGILGLIRQDIPELERDTLIDLLPDATTPFAETDNNMGAGILNAARLQEEVASLLGNDEPSLHHAMAVRTDSDGNSPFWQHLDQDRLCNLYEFQANAEADSSADHYSVFRIPEGEALELDNADHVLSAPDTRFLLTRLEPGQYDYGLQFCNSNGGQCGDNTLIPLNTERMQPPARCL